MLRFLKGPVIGSFYHPPPYHFHFQPQIKGLSTRSSLLTSFIKSNPSTTGGVKISSKSRPPKLSPLASGSHSSKSSPLSSLPYGVLLRSYLVAALCSSSVLLSSVLRLLSRLANSDSVFLNPDRNLFLHYLLKKTFYAHFCAGENPNEVGLVVAGLKRMGFSGIILTYAKEISPNRHGTPELMMSYSDDDVRSEVETWKQGTLKTVRLAGEGDLVALKLTGAGHFVEQQLAIKSAPCARMKDALQVIFDAAKEKGVGILIDAEQNYIQAGIDSWALQAQEKYNHGKTVIFNTYQAYLQSAPATLAQHLAFAHEKGFVLGVKLVRGAYFATDPHDIFWSSKADTDLAYDGIAEALIRRKYNNVLTLFHPQQELVKEGPNAQFPEINIVLATHNPISVRNAVRIWNEERLSSTRRADIAFGQLMGMADEISGELIITGRNANEEGDGGLRIYKYLPWGTVGECLGYLTRRADENRQAVERAREGRKAINMELRRRMMMTMMGR